MNLDECRARIDEIDAALLRLFAERMDVVGEVANYKKEHDLPIFHPEREAAIIQNKLQTSPEEIKTYVKSFFINLMEYSKCLQLGKVDEAPTIPYQASGLQDNPKTTVIYQGSEGAYQHLAALRLFEQAVLTPVASFNDVFDAVQSGKASYGIVPFENSTAGSVDDVYDLLAQYDLYINQMDRLKIEHCLLTRPETAPEDITAIYSHPQSLLQCRRYLHGKEYTTHPYANNALAAQFVAESTLPIAAICSAECAELYGLTIQERAIQDISDNYTRFIVLSKELLVAEDAKETAVCIRIPNRADELNKLLTKFSIYGINMNKIESRPIGDKDFSVTFYISFSGTVRDQNVLDLLHDLRYHYEWFQLLGSYPID